MILTMEGLSLEPPSANKRTIWPVVLVILHGVCFIAGFCLAIPVSMSYVVGRCVLYGYTESSSEAEYGWVWFPGSHNHCNYVMGISSMFCIVYSAGIIVFQTYLFLKSERRGTSCLGDYFGLVNIVISAMNIIGMILLLVAACIVSVGFAQWCSEIAEFVKGTCEDFQNLRWGQDPNNEDDWKQYDFYDQLVTAEASIWVCFVMWLLITGIGLFNLWRIGALPCLPQPGRSRSENTSAENNQTRY